MIPIIIPVGATRDQITESFGKTVTTKEMIFSLRNLKKNFDETIKKSNSISNNSYTKQINVVMPKNVYEDPIGVQEGGQPRDPITGEIVRSAMGRFAAYVPVAEAVRHVPLVGDIIAGAVGGAMRTQSLEGAIVGGITGGVIGGLKLVVNTAVPGLGYGVDAVVLVVEYQIGYNFGGATVGTSVGPTPTPTPTPLPTGGGTIYDAQYMKDYANITEGVDEIYKELKTLMGPVYFAQFIQKCKEVYTHKKVIRPRVIELEDHILAVLYLLDYLELASMDSFGTSSKNTMRNLKYN